jgi:hypothetical protein
MPSSLRVSVTLREVCRPDLAVGAAGTATATRVGAGSRLPVRRTGGSAGAGIAWHAAIAAVAARAAGISRAAAPAAAGGA